MANNKQYQIVMKSTDNIFYSDITEEYPTTEKIVEVMNVFKEKYGEPSIPDAFGSLFNIYVRDIEVFYGSVNV